MDRSIDIARHTVPVRTVNTAIVGTGAAGYCAADRLHALGQRDIAIITEGRLCGTSRNTGSDKQTYYKLSMAGDAPDSVMAMAEDLFAGGCVDGDHALCEAALSARGFYRLAELGVPFPHGRYGEYVGYKTDHDPRTRATSAGPYTSRMMTEALEQSVRDRGIAVWDGLLLIDILIEESTLRGLLCLAENGGYVLIQCKNAILATGGPAGIYAHSVYPESQHGATGVALRAGVKGQNLTEWQYGLASTRPRWNVSGTFMQALPRFISTDMNGGDAREFLCDAFVDAGELLSMVFLKGYQWPFDVRRAEDGSSRIDLLVQRETEKGRRVFLDYRENLGGKPVDFEALSDEAQTYLRRAGACFGTPFERLWHMNAPAVAFYRDHGIDLAADRLEIALCAQHNNGGLAVDHWWQTSVAGLFAAGECAATHGVYRPGGSALNAGQVGATRAAEYIAATQTGDADDSVTDAVRQAIFDAMAIGDTAMAGGESNVVQRTQAARLRMSLCGGPLREGRRMAEVIAEIDAELDGFAKTVRINGVEELPALYRLRDALLCQRAYIAAMADYIAQGGTSRGGARYLDAHGGGIPTDRVQETACVDGAFVHTWRPVRPIPREDLFFENVWRAYREAGDALYG